MRPLLVPSSYFPNPGGVEEVSRRLAQGLVERGNSPLVMTSRWPKTLPDRETVDSVTVVRPSFRTPHRSVRGMAGWLMFSRSTRREVIAEARRHGTDLVNLHCVSTNAPYCVALARALDVPLVVSIHGEISCDATDVFRRSPYMRHVLRKVMAAADHVTAPSTYSLREAEAMLGRRLPHASVIGNGVDLDLFGGERAVPTRRTVFGVGRLVHTKGFDVLIDAMGLTGSELADVELVIGGDGPERARLEDQARRSPARDRIIFLGRLDREQVAERMRQADVFVLPSREEAQGLTVLEAMAAGAPVVAAAVGGVPETVRHEQNGLLFNSGDARELAAAIAQTLGDGSARSVRVASARATVASRSWSHLIDQFTKVYRQAAS